MTEPEMRTELLYLVRAVEDVTEELREWAEKRIAYLKEELEKLEKSKAS